MDIAVNVQLEAAQEELEKFAKDAAERYSIPESIVEAGLFNRLKELAAKNNQTAQSLVGGWKKAGNSVEGFIEKAKDAIQYLGASPAQFMPALNSLMANIKKIDPVTGKVTEAFKKGYDALKEWASVTFDKLSQRIQKLRKSVEGGFLDKKALESEFKDLSKELKLQVVADLEPTRDLYKDSRAFESVVASEYMTRMGELGGEALAAQAREEFAKSAQWTGASIGRAILSEVERESYRSTVRPSGGTEQPTSPDTQGQKDITRSIIDSLSPIISKIETAQLGQVSIVQDITSSISPLSSIVQTFTSGLSTMRDTVAASTSGFSGIQDALISTQDSIYSLENTILAFEEVVLSTEDSLRPMLSSLIEQMAVRYSEPERSIVNATLDIHPITSSLDAVKGAVDGNAALLEDIHSAIESVGSTLQSRQSTSSGGQSVDVAKSVLSGITPLITKLGEYQAEQASTAQQVNSAIAPVTAAMQSLISGLTAMRTSTAANTAALEAMRGSLSSVVDALSSQPTGTTYNIEIRQEGFVVQNKNDATTLARATVNAIKSGLGNGM